MSLEKHIQELREEILELKKERNAIILASSYQTPYVQNIADFVGSSLQLAQKAQKLDNDIIVFAGVDFMANTSKILNPDKTVLIPDDRAKCQLARMLKVEDLEEAKKKFPKAPVLIYTNSSAECQALADIVYTAANAVDIVDRMAKERGSNVIIFGPDVNIAYFVGKRLNYRGLVKTREGIKTITGLEKGDRLLYAPSHGYCHPHVNIFPLQIKNMRKEYPNARVLVHSECDPEVQESADFVGSTGDMVRYVKESEAKEFIIGTERDFCYKLKTDIPNKIYHPIGELSENYIECPAMKLISLDRIRDSLKYNIHKVEVPENIAKEARITTERMLDFS